MKVKPVETTPKLVQRPKSPEPKPRKEKVPSAVPSPDDVKASLERKLERSARQMNVISRVLGQRYQFSIDKTTNQLVVKIVDVLTGEVIRQVPPEEMLKLAAQMKYMVGIFMDQLI